MLQVSNDSKLASGLMLDPLVQLSQYVLGHVYTRMIHKAATAYGTLKEHHIELAIIEELLDQTYWRKGKRATWYERRALILEKYISADYELIKNRYPPSLGRRFHWDQYDFAFLFRFFLHHVLQSAGPA